MESAMIDQVTVCLPNEPHSDRRHRSSPLGDEPCHGCGSTSRFTPSWVADTTLWVIGVIVRHHPHRVRPPAGRPLAPARSKCPSYDTTLTQVVGIEVSDVPGGHSRSRGPSRPSGRRPTSTWVSTLTPVPWADEAPGAPTHRHREGHGRTACHQAVPAAQRPHDGLGRGALRAAPGLSRDGRHSRPGTPLRCLRLDVVLVGCGTWQRTVTQHVSWRVEDHT